MNTLSIDSGTTYKIPHTCTLNMPEHKRMLLCWGITSGFVSQSHDVEGPNYCHFCEYSCMSDRLMEKWWQIMKRKMQ